ncbi:hypothetical protein SASC598J21_023420 [Snodgrassella alvi SCGC AB-598-J21]|uniref:Uncharacterized protein n=1 Tax=Snodgrassella alvi SCGC AB-598-J21 TaxID=1385367 RepID=A0A074V3Z8_9NEIS|nr:hypothetical protein SASC598J21_023420 [Snodgrassella alvi SCGC AB-598-J21]
MIYSIMYAGLVLSKFYCASQFVFSPIALKSETVMQTG